MTDTLVLKSGLKMPSSFVEVKDEEMEYVDGGVITVAAVCAITTAVIAVLGACYGAGFAIGTCIRDTFNVHKVSWGLQLILHIAAFLVAPCVGNALVLGIVNGIQSR